MKLLDFSRKLGRPIVLGDFLVVEIAEAAFNAFDLLGQFGRYLRWLRAEARVLRQEAVFGIEHRLGPRPLRA